MDFGIISQEIPEGLQAPSAEGRPAPRIAPIAVDEFLAEPSARADFAFERPSTIPLRVVRELTAADLQVIAKAPARPASPPTVMALRASHHRLAQLLASGKAPADVSLLTGTSTGTISRLRRDPAFLGLLEYYLGKTEIKMIDVVTRMAEVGRDAIDMLHERMLEEPERFSPGMLLKIAEVLVAKPAEQREALRPGASGPPVAIAINFRSPERLLPDVSDAIEVEEVK